MAFSDYRVRNTWLQVTVLANERTGLAASDVFYFASVAGDTCQGGGDFGIADSNDQSPIRANPTLGFNIAPLDNPLDINRSKKVDANDRLIIRQDPVIGFARAQPITVPGPGGGGGGGSSAVSTSSHAATDHLLESWYGSNDGNAPKELLAARQRATQRLADSVAAVHWIKAIPRREVARRSLSVRRLPRRSPWQPPADKVEEIDTSLRRER